METNGKSLPPLTIDDVLAQVHEPEVEAVECREWNGTVYLRAPSSAEFDRARDRLAKDDATEQATLVACCWSDPSGAKAEITPTQIQALADMPNGAKTLARLALVAMRLTGLDAATREEAEKNSEAGQNADSG